MSNAQTISFRRRHLPHWMVADHSFFVTIRLKGSLPSFVAEHLRRERDALTSRRCSNEEMEKLRREQFKRMEAILDSTQQGPKFLHIAPVADIVFRAFEWLQEKKGWQVHAATIMPNHLHILLRHPGGQNNQLNRDLGILKGFTAREANKYLDRVGKPFWMGENFDHWCRNDAKVTGAARYIAMNPVKAGLVEDWKDWPWTRVCQAFLPDINESKSTITGRPRSGMNA